MLNVGANSTRRVGIAACFMLVLLLLSSACGSQQTTLAAPTEFGRGGVLKVASMVEPASLDPLNGSAIGKDRGALNLFYENLVYLDYEGSLQPQLAESWMLAPDGLSVDFVLHKGVRFHDGTSFDALAVKANIDRLTADVERSTATRLASAVKGAEVLSEHRVRIHFERVSGAVMSVLASEPGMMVSPKALDNERSLRRAPVGTGPFVLDQWVGGFKIRAQSNPNYWRRGRDGELLPYLDGVEIRFMADTSAMIFEAQVGTLDVTDILLAKDFERVQREPGLTLNPYPQQISHFLAINNQSSSLAENEILREAISLAINRGQIEAIISKGAGRVNPTWVTHADLAYDATLRAQTSDKSMARALYQESDFAENLVLSIIGRDPDRTIAQIIQAQLAEADIPLKIEVLEREAWLNKTRAPSHDLALLRSSPASDPHVRFSAYYLPGSLGNYSAINDQFIITQIEKAEALIDADSRREEYAAIQEYLLGRTMEIYLFSRPSAEAIRDHVKGLIVESVGSFNFSETYLAQPAAETARGLLQSKRSLGNEEG